MRTSIYCPPSAQLVRYKIYLGINKEKEGDSGNGL
jgi:hypothetical protein